MYEEMRRVLESSMEVVSKLEADPSRRNREKASEIRETLIRQAHIFATYLGQNGLDYVMVREEFLEIVNLARAGA